MARVVLLFPLLALTLADAGMHVARTSETLESLEAQAKNSPSDFVVWNKIADARLRLLSSTGDLANLTRAAEAVERSLNVSTPEFNHGGLALRTRVESTSHRFKEAQLSAQQLHTVMPDSAYALGLLGDAFLNLGDYEACERVWNQMLTIDKGVLLTEPRFAQLDLVHGRVQRARERLMKIIESARKLEPEAPDVVGWFQVQLGELAFKSGDWDTAEQEYNAALEVQPDYHAALDHLAELRGAEGRLEEAVALYLRVIERVPRPEYLQALGDLYLFVGKAAEAKPWHERALAAYLASVEQGEVLYFHHLAGFYADSFNNPKEAVDWARRDLTLRHSIQAYDTLAWALYKAGKVEEARDTISQALTSGTKDPHILYHAGTIFMRAGDIPVGKARLQEALSANPRYNTFHVHRG